VTASRKVGLTAWNRTRSNCSIPRASLNNPAGQSGPYELAA
jgi:hypothetical protein